MFSWFPQLTVDCISCRRSNYTFLQWCNKNQSFGTCNLRVFLNLYSCATSSPACLSLVITFKYTTSRLCFRWDSQHVLLSVKTQNWTNFIESEPSLLILHTSLQIFMVCFEQYLLKNMRCAQTRMCTLIRSFTWYVAFQEKCPWFLSLVAAPVLCKQATITNKKKNREITLLSKNFQWNKEHADSDL